MTYFSKSVFLFGVPDSLNCECPSKNPKNVPPDLPQLKMATLVTQSSHYVHSRDGLQLEKPQGEFQTAEVTTG